MLTVALPVATTATLYHRLSIEQLAAYSCPGNGLEGGGLFELARNSFSDVIISSRESRFSESSTYFNIQEVFN